MGLAPLYAPGARGTLSACRAAAGGSLPKREHSRLASLLLGAALQDSAEYRVQVCNPPTPHPPQVPIQALNYMGGFVTLWGGLRSHTVAHKPRRPLEAGGGGRGWGLTRLWAGEWARPWELWAEVIQGVGVARRHSGPGAGARLLAAASGRWGGGRARLPDLSFLCPSVLGGRDESSRREFGMPSAALSPGPAGAGLVALSPQEWRCR